MDRTSKIRKHASNGDTDITISLKQQARSEPFAEFTQMADESAHPTDEMLYSYVQDRLNDEEIDFVLDHMFYCKRCPEQILQIRFLETELDKAQSELMATDDLQPSRYEKLLKKLQEEFIVSLNSITEGLDVWHPELAGIPSVSADIPKQKREFVFQEGDIAVSCFWRALYGTSPAYIEIEWNAKLVEERVLWAFFIQPDTEEILARIPLGTDLEGIANLTSDVLEFDPAHDPWALSILLKEN